MNEAEKAEFLKKHGLTEKKYSPNNEPSDEYPYAENISGTIRYYKIVPMEIPNEDFERLKAYYESISDEPKKTGGAKELATPSGKRSYISSKTFEENDPIAVALTVVAWIVFVGGFIAGIVLGKQPVVSSWGSVKNTEFSFALACLYWVLSGITGLMFLGFARIIKLLNRQSEENQAQITILNEIADKLCNSKD